MTEVRNPYAAPDAAVADVAAPGVVPPENKHVKWACIVLWCSLAITLIALPVAVKQQPEVVSGTFGWGGTLATGILGAVFAALIIWWVTAKLSAGRNWMRWLVTIFYGLSTIISPFSWASSELAAQSFASPLIGTLTILSYITNLVTLVLVNTPSAREWFAAMKLSRA